MIYIIINGNMINARLIEMQNEDAQNSASLFIYVFSN